MTVTLLDIPPDSIGPESPCIRLCVLDPSTGWCEGCGRTGDEIAQWMSLTDTGRIAIKRLLPARLEALAAQAGLHEKKD